MEALQGRRDEGEVVGKEMKAADLDPVERWIEELRKDLEEGDRSENKLAGLRSEAMFGRVWEMWERTKAERARGSWPGSWIARLRRSRRSLTSRGT